MTLNDFFRDHPAAALAFSGGVDSAYLLHAGLACGAVGAVFFHLVSWATGLALCCTAGV